MSQPRLVVATRNRAKGQELAELLAPLGLEVHNLADYPAALEVEESGESFAANAAKKACQQAQQLGEWVVADDSGLEVDALGGRPGVYSARYAGPNATDEQNNQRLLDELQGVPLQQRTARYVCHLALADPQGTIRAEAEAYCRGRIASRPRGSHGFGYDPLFEIIEYRRTFGELPPAVKACLSHRARAIQAIARHIERLVHAGQWLAPRT